MKYLLTLLLLAGCTPKPVNDCGFIKNVYGQRITWAQLPITIHIDSSVPANLKQSVYIAMTTWEQAIGRKTFNVVEDSSRISRDKINGIYFLTTWEKDRPSEQGRTSAYWAGDEIVEADIRINGLNFSYYTNYTTNGQYNFESLMVHELGHLLGLSHRKMLDSVMQPELRSMENRSELFPIDVQSIQCGYL